MANKDSAVLKIGADIKDPQKAIAEINSLVKKMGENINTSSGIAVKAFRAEAEEADRLLRSLGASDKQLGDLAKTTQRVNSAVDAHLSKIGGAARMMASGFEGMARTGKVAGEATKAVISSGAEMALMFGGAGPIVGAVGIAGLAIYSMFERTRKEMEETKKKALADLLAIASSVDVLKSAEGLRNLTSGNTDARLLASQGRIDVNDLSPEQLGIEGLRQRIAQRSRGLPAFTQQGAGPGGATQDPFADTRAKIRADEEALTELVKKRADIEVLYTAALARTNDMAVVGAAIAKETAGHKQAEKDAQERIANLMRDAKNDARDAASLRQFVGDTNAALGRVVPLDRSRPDIGAPVTAADARASAEAGLAGVAAPDFWTRVAAGIQEADAAQLDFANNMASVTTASVQGFAEASVHAFLLFAESGKLTGKGFGQFVLTGVEQAAAGKAVFYLAEGFGALAMAALGHPGAPGAASFDFKAAGIMAGLAGGAGALGGNAAGGRTAGAAGGGTRTASFNSGLGDTFGQQAPGEITIVGGILDTNDMRQMNALAEAIRSLTGRSVRLFPS
jgi:hypothetical protein